MKKNQKWRGWRTKCLYAITVIFLLIFGLKDSFAGPVITYTGFENIRISHLTTANGTKFINPPYATVNQHYLLRSFEKQGKDNFLLRNLDFEMIYDKPSEAQGLSGDESVRIKSKFSLLENFKILGMIKSALPQQEDEVWDYSLQVGPSLKMDDVGIRSFYRKIRSVNGYGSQGLFLELNYHAWNWFSIEINADSEWKDTGGRSLNRKHSLFKTLLTPFKFSLFETGIDIVSINNTDSYTYFAEFDTKWNDYNSFIEYKLESIDDNWKSDTNTVTAGLNRIWDRIEAWVKGGLIKEEHGVDEDRYFGKFGVNYSPATNVKLTFENSYERLVTTSHKDGKIEFNGTVKLGLPLPFGMECKNRFSVNKMVEGDTDYHFVTTIKLGLDS